MNALSDRPAFVVPCFPSFPLAGTEAMHPRHQTGRWLVALFRGWPVRWPVLDILKIYPNCDPDAFLTLTKALSDLEFVGWVQRDLYSGDLTPTLPASLPV